MGSRVASVLALVLLACLGGAGCVHREIVITSDPPGATVTVNQTWTGVTPYTLTIKQYGVYDIRIEKEGYYPLHVPEPVRAPAYEHTGPDLIAAMAPVRLQDRKEFHYTLEKIEKEDDMEGIFARGAEIKTRAEESARERKERDADRKPIHMPLPEKKGKKGKGETADENASKADEKQGPADAAKPPEAIEGVQEALPAAPKKSAPAEK